MRSAFLPTALAVTVFSHALPGPAPAQEVTSSEIVEALTRPPAPRTRSLRGVNVTEPEQVRPPSIDLSIGFGFDSAELTTEGALIVRRLAHALQDERLSGASVMIVGHTDAKGSDEYNQELSERRSQAVRDQLVFYFEIPPDRLAAVGMGEQQLALPGDPENERNRRVEVRLQEVVAQK